LLLLAITDLFGQHVRNSIDAFKNEINPDGVKLIQAEPAPVPKTVAAFQPTDEEVQLLQRSLATFLETADSSAKEVAKKYPGLITRSIRTMARTGLRMMPTSPYSSFWSDAG
jgi:hypothetical protein